MEQFTNLSKFRQVVYEQALTLANRQYVHSLTPAEEGLAFVLADAPGSSGPKLGLGLEFRLDL